VLTLALTKSNRLLSPDSKYKFCSNCGTPGKLCEFAACMRGVCCQPNPQCPQCSGQANGVVGQLSVKRMDPSKVRTVGMMALKPLRGVELLRRRHSTDGHASLPITVKNLKLEGLFDSGMVTLKDVEIFSKQGCGPCELAKMRRRPFSIKVETERVAAPLLGDHFTFDVLEVRTPCIHTGAKFLYVVIEKVSKYAIGGSMRGYSEENVVSALNEIKARVRPVHGEINIFRMDSHPSHRSKHVRDYLIDNQQHLQLSPSYVHEGVGDVENYFLHRVPSANALIIAAPDLDESHFAQALFYVIDASNHSVTSGSVPPKSPSMIYHSLDKFNPSGLQVFGSAAMAFVHGEARGSKFNEHAVPCIYMGPAINSDSRAHCCVFLKREYKDVDLGCINVTERVVLERTHRGHPSTQPYNQVAAEEAVDLGKPASIFDLSGMDYTDDELPHTSRPSRVGARRGRAYCHLRPSPLAWAAPRWRYDLVDPRVHAQGCQPLPDRLGHRWARAQPHARSDQGGCAAHASERALPRLILPARVQVVHGLALQSARPARSV